MQRPMCEKEGIFMICTEVYIEYIMYPFFAFLDVDIVVHIVGNKMGKHILSVR